MSGTGPWRAALVVCSIIFRADRLRVALTVLFGLAGMLAVPLQAGLVAFIVERAAVGDRSSAVAGALGLGAAFIAGESLQAVAFRLEIGARDAAAHAIEREILARVAAVPQLEFFDDPASADHLDMLLKERWRLPLLLSALNMYLGLAVQGLATVALLTTAGFSALALVAAALPTLAAARYRARLINDAKFANASVSRRRSALRATGLTVGANMESRTVGSPTALPELRSTLFRQEDETAAAAAARGHVAQVAAWVLFGAALAALLYRKMTAPGVPNTGHVALLVTLGVQVRSQLRSAAGSYDWLVGNLRSLRYFAWLGDAAATRSGSDHLRASTSAPAQAPPIVLDDVGFTYPGAAAGTLAGISLLVPGRGTVAIVGPNGAGKTTLANIIAGLYSPTSGRMTVGGVDVASLEPEARRRGVAVARQDGIRPAVTVAEAILLGVGGDDGSTAIDRPAELADATAMISSLPDGPNTQLGRQFPSGTDLSGGQWQRLTLARAMAPQHPRVLILDEPSASLDPAAEFALFTRFSTEMREEIADLLVVVSHRLGGVVGADMIIVVEGGAVVEHGTHAELIEGHGHYRRMFEAQAAGYR